MRTLLLSAALAASLFVVSPLASSSSAQEGASALASRYGIAVVDISYIFKNYGRFKASMDDMKKDVEATEVTLKKERTDIAAMQEDLKRFNPGTPDYKQRDEAVAKAKADFNLKATRQRKDFMEREAKIYHQTYLEVNDAVKLYAQRNNIGLVLRFNGDPIDANQRQDVLRAINKPVVYQNGIDITPEILRSLDRSRTARQQPHSGSQIPGRNR